MLFDHGDSLVVSTNEACLHKSDLKVGADEIFTLACANIC